MLPGSQVPVVGLLTHDQAGLDQYYQQSGGLRAGPFNLANVVEADETPVLPTLQLHPLART